MNQPKAVVVQKWPELSKDELISYYNEIKANKIIKLDWKNPGRIDPKLYYANKTEKQESHDENSAKESSNGINFTSNPLENVISSSTIDINKFDLFDEDDFNETEEKKTSNEIFNLRLIHSNTRSRSSDNRVASMDKILDDMRKKYETEHKQVATDDAMLMGNENFGDEDQTNVFQQTETKKKQEDKPIVPDQPENNNQTETNTPGVAVAAEPNLNSVEQTGEPEMLTYQTGGHLNEQIDSEKATCEYIETSTPYQQANDSEMLPDGRKYETPMNVEQIDSIRSNNRDDSTDDKTNELSDTTEEIETFTRKETNQYRVLSVAESVTDAAPMSEQSSGKFDDFSEKTENVASNDFRSDPEPDQDQDQTKEVDSTTYKSRSPSPKTEEPTVAVAKVESNDLNTITENTSQNDQSTVEESSQKDFFVNENKTILLTTEENLDDDPLISRDLSTASNSQIELLANTISNEEQTTAATETHNIIPDEPDVINEID